MSQEIKAIVTRIISAISSDTNRDPALLHRLYEMNPKEIRNFILNDIRSSFSGGKTRLPELSDTIRDLAEWQVRYNREKGLGQINASSVISTVLTAAATAGSLYLAYKGSKDAEDLAKQQLQLQQQLAAQQAEAQTQAQMQAQLQAQAQTQVQAQPGIPTWMIVAGIAAVVIGGFFLMRKR